MLPPTGPIDPRLIETLYKMRMADPGLPPDELRNLVAQEMQKTQVTNPFKTSSVPPLLPQEIDYDNLSRSERKIYEEQGFDLSPELYAPGSTAERLPMSAFEPDRSGYTTIFDAPGYSDSAQGIGGGASDWKYNSIDEIMRDAESGKIDQAQMGMLRDQFNREGSADIPYSRPNIDDKGRLLVDDPSKYGGDSVTWKDIFTTNPMFFTPDISANSAFYTAGRAFGAPKGTKGRGLTAGASLAAGILDVGRSFASGFGLSKVNQEYRDWMDKKIREQDRNYVADPQSRDVNYTGGFSFAKYGGKMGDLPKYENGDEHRDPRIIVAPSEKEVNYSTLPIEELVEMRKSLFQDPRYEKGVLESQGRTGVGAAAFRGQLDKIDQAIKNREIHMLNFPEKYDQDYDPMFIQGFSNSTIEKQNFGGLFGDKMSTPSGTNFAKLMQHFGDRVNKSPLTSEEQVNNAPDMSAYEVGQPVTFEYGGKMVSGTIKKIENGKIYI